MQTAVKAKKHRNQAVSVRFWAGRTYRGRIKDDHKIDPACGSGGMFAQAARYMHAHNASKAEQMKFRYYGVEKEPDTVKHANDSSYA